MIVAKDLQRILKKLNYETTDPFASGKKALEQLEFLRPDFILLDINLKGEMDGIQLAEIYRKENSSIKVIFMTGFEMEDKIAEHLLEEYGGFLNKPFKMDPLLRLVESLSV